VRPQHQRLGQRAVDGCHRDGAVWLLEIGQCRGEHAEPRQRGAQRDPGRVREGLVEVGVVDDRGEQLEDLRPALGAVVDDDGDPTCLTPGRPARGEAADYPVGVGVMPGSPC
jgi:hypothetical protein